MGSSEGLGGISHKAWRNRRCGGGRGGNGLGFALIFGLDSRTWGSGSGMGMGRGVGGSVDGAVGGVLASIDAIKLSRRAIRSASCT